MVLGDEFGRVIAGARDADQNCLAALYRDLNPRLLRYLRSRAANHAEDLASETWIAASRNIVNFHGDEDGFRRWLFTIAHRQVIAHYRKEGRRKTDPVESQKLDRASVDFAEGFSDDLAARELFAALTAALPADQAEVVRLRVLGELSMEEIGQILGKKTGTVRVLFHRAVQRIARDMPQFASRRLQGGGVTK